MRWRLLGALAAAVLAGCAAAPQAPAGEDWHSVSIPGKELTHYRWALKEGRLALHATSEQSASMWRRRVEPQAPVAREVSFSWWVPAVLREASVADAKREDAPVRVLLAFSGDESRLPWRTRALFDLAEALTGERPPYATLMYVWDAHAPHDSVVINPRTDRIRKIVVDAADQGLAQWRDHRRDFVADFRRAYGEEPGALVAVAVMTDTDNTGTRAEAWYGPIRFH
jgi:Protein of unknown function (DUF3047)